MAVWSSLCNRFQAQSSDSQVPSAPHFVDAMLDAGMGLTNVVFWSSASLASARSALVRNVTTSTSVQLWGGVTWHADLDGLSLGGSRPQSAAFEQAIAWRADGLGQCLTMQCGR